MTLADLLYQAGFWQWIGILLLASIFCKYASQAISGFTPLAKHKTVNHYHRAEDCD